jgi:hypothetical protein
MDISCIFPISLIRLIFILWDCAVMKHSITDDDTNYKEESTKVLYQTKILGEIVPTSRFNLSKYNLYLSAASMAGQRVCRP